MVDPTSDLKEDVEEADAPECTACGAAIVEESTHRVVTWVEDDAVQTVHFCDDDCRDQWES